MAFSSVSSPVQLDCQGILFDMDGTLISSVDSVERSWTKWAQMRGVDPRHACQIAHGCRAIDTVAKLRPDLDSVAELAVIEEIELADCEGVAVLPGVRKLLAALSQAGEAGTSETGTSGAENSMTGACKALSGQARSGEARARWTVVTSATERITRRRLELSGLCGPAQFVHAECVTVGKPHPAPFLAGAALLGFDPRECVVVEDSPSGAIAGRAAGCTVVATTYSHSVDSLAAAHYVVQDLTGVRVSTLHGNRGLRLDFTSIKGR